MAVQNSNAAAPYSMIITFEIAPEDEAEFNDIYDNDHIPNILKLKDCVEIIRFRDAAPNEKGLLVAQLVSLEGRFLFGRTVAAFPKIISA